VKIAVRALKEFTRAAWHWPRFYRDRKNVKINLAQLNKLNGWLPPALLAASLLLGGCSALGVSMPSNIDIPENDPSFRSRVYAGASIGNSKFDPDMSVAPAFDVSNKEDTSSQMRIGYDIHNMLAVEVETGVLGAADLSAPNLVNAGLNVKYSSISASALIYGINGVQNRSRREGWSAYGRLGYNYLKRASRVTSLDTSSTRVLLGLGAEYGMKNGFGIRGEITRYDDDAMSVGVGTTNRQCFC